MSIGEFDVDALLSDAVPELAAVVHEHREQWPDSGMLYSLVAQLFDLVVEAGQRDDADGRDLVRRAFALTERMLVEGTPPVSDCFSIQMLEPLMGDPHHEHFPNFEFAMGPVTLEDLRSKIEWLRRDAAMSVAIVQANRLVERKVCLWVGVGGDTARVGADRTIWNEMNRAARAGLFEFLRSAWMELRGRSGDGASGLEITDTVETRFEVLADDSTRL
jgi:hypothetical protein